jgi:hypothetical protein
MKRMICGMLSATLMLASVPARAAAENATLLTESAVQNHFRRYYMKMMKKQTTGQ